MIKCPRERLKIVEKIGKIERTLERRSEQGREEGRRRPMTERNE